MYHSENANVSFGNATVPSGNVIVPSENAKNRPEMQHDGVNFISALFFLFPADSFYFRRVELVFVLGKMVGEKKDLQGF
ncbi:hypothetical protein [Draconibacterium orientale]|uniref:hypothetical protein n=1 Tax=Draconibacterium orientale TaxID=1168034 RepID=UPI002A0A968E|nr:hypothetical protein [Draconibacterium orientale]